MVNLSGLTTETRNPRTLFGWCSRRPRRSSATGSCESSNCAGPYSVSSASSTQ